MSVRNLLWSAFGAGLLVGLMACNDKTGQKAEGPVDLLSQRAVLALDSLPDRVALGDSVRFAVRLLDPNEKFDSVQVRINGKPAGNGPGMVAWSTRGSVCGNQEIAVAGFRKGQEVQSARGSFRVMAGKSPVLYTYEVVARYPHNPASFTQGLEWMGNTLYEGTGLNGQSAVMEVQVKTGSAVKRTNLDAAYFGEGISIWNKELFQITWQNHKGFVYRLPDLKKVREFTYPTEGWGLCHLPDHVVMSDGSERLYFMDRAQFSTRYVREVWDNRRPVDNLNELEYVKGSIWANKYQTDTLVEIDPATGEVLGYLDLSGILPDTERTGEEDVLNGIAYHAGENLFYVTGKKWSALFAIRIRKNNPGA